MPYDAILAICFLAGVMVGATVSLVLGLLVGVTIGLIFGLRVNVREAALGGDGVR